MGREIWDVIEDEHVAYVNRHYHRARNLRHGWLVPIGKHSDSSFKYASFPAKTNTQGDSQGDSTVAALKDKYFGNANLSALFKTQTDLFAGAESIGRQFGGGGFGANDANKLQSKSQKLWVKPVGMYHPDYREDFQLSNEPYRYYNW